MAAKKQGTKPKKRLTVAEKQQTIHEEKELKGLDYLAVEWMEPDNLLLLECWSRDGYTLKDIASRIGISHYTLIRWRKKFAPIQKALSMGREIIDYKVENALLKAALGYQTSELKVTTTMENGKASKVVTERTEKEQAPNIYAIQSWLYNRCPDKWKKNRDNATINIGDDQQIEVTVTRASRKPVDDGEENPDHLYDDSINTSVVLKNRKEEDRGQETSVTRTDSTSNSKQR